MKKLLCIATILASTSALATTPSTNSLSTDQQLKNLEQQSQELQHEISALQEHAKKTKPHRLLSHVFIGSFSPFLKKKEAYDASDILEQSTSINEQVVLLKKQEAFLNKLAKQGLSQKRPYLQLSGGLEGQVYYNDDGFRSYSKDQGINLSTGEIDMDAAINPWANGFLSLTYNNAPRGEGNRQPSREVYLERGIITLGDLMKSPFYGSIGQMYVPFGSYSSAQISTPVTESVGRILSATAIVGYSYHGLNISAFGYSGSMTSDGSPIIKQGGGDIGFRHAFGSNNDFQIRFSYVSNIADSQGMQGNGYNLPGSKNYFTGFSEDYFPGTSPHHQGNDLKHRVGAGDINTLIKFNHFTLLGEYLTPFTHFANQDLQFNQQGAEPQAVHAEIQYHMHVKNHPLTFAFGYGHTWQALSLNLPENSYSAVIATSLLKDTIQSIEFRHDTDYSKGTEASGAGVTQGLHQVFAGTGKSRESAILQVGVYF